jgi:hypothetical protein
MSLKWARGKFRPQDLQRTTACVQSLAGWTGPPQSGQCGVLGRGLLEKKNIVASPIFGRPGFLGKAQVVNWPENG